MSGDRPKRRWFQFTLRSMLLLMLFVCAYLGGRWSRQTEVDELRAEAERSRQAAQQAAERSSRRVYLPSLPGIPFGGSIDQGMKADALERMRRFEGGTLMP